MVSVLQAFKLSSDNGEILDLELLLSEIVDVFGRGEEEPEPTLRAAMRDWVYIRTSRLLNDKFKS